MSYSEKFEELKAKTIKGFGIGLVGAIVLVYAITSGFKGYGFFEIIACCVPFTIIFGSVTTILICAKSGATGFLGNRAMDMVGTVFDLSAFAIAGFSPVVLALFLFKLAIMFVFCVPIMIYISVSFICNLVYISIMCYLEKHNKLEEKETLCLTLDKCISISPVVITFIACAGIIASL